MKRTVLTVITIITATICLSAKTDSATVSDLELEMWLKEYATATDEGIKDGNDSTVAPPDTIRPDTLTLPATAISTKTDSDSIAPKNAHSIISDAFSKSNGMKQNNSKKTTTKAKTSSGSKTKSTKKNNHHKSTPRPVIPKIELCKQQLISAEDSLIIHIQALTKADYNPLFMEWVKGIAPYKNKSLTDADSTITELRNGIKKEVSLTEPDLYDYHRSQLPKTSDIKSKNIKGADKEKLLLHSDLLSIKNDNIIEIAGPKIPKWKPGAKIQLQASQNFISANWYKGGESNITGFLYVMGSCNYNNRKGIEWDNKLEWKLGVNSTGSDSLRMLRINDDLLRINSKLGVKAISTFFYTAEIDFQTTLFNTYKSQTYIRTSGPFSPIRTNISLGMDYKYKDKLSIFLSPLSYKLVYVADTSYHSSVAHNENIPHQVGMENGARMINQLGALLRIGWEHKFNESIDMEVKFSFFGNYVGYRKGIETDLEVIANFQINRFLSAKISLNPRYDSTVPTADGTKPKLQFRELISLGFNYIL